MLSLTCICTCHALRHFAYSYIQQSTLAHIVTYIYIRPDSRLSTVRESANYSGIKNHPYKHIHNTKLILPLFITRVFTLGYLLLIKFYASSQEATLLLLWRVVHYSLSTTISLYRAILITSYVVSNAGGGSETYA